MFEGKDKLIVWCREEVEQAFQAGARQGWNDAMEEAAKLVMVGAGGFDMSYLECVEKIRALANKESSK
jgi:hypothetical protein